MIDPARPAIARLSVSLARCLSLYSSIYGLGTG
jgi:hypothetical protein